MFDGSRAHGSSSDQRILERIVAVFNREFGELYHTALIPGADEPLYRPPCVSGASAELFSREDFPASALHESAHWCLAGERRRQQVDFGYWYAAQGRNAEQQRAFQQVEIKPQAIEWALTRAVGLDFRVSIDNLGGEELDPFGFELAVYQQAMYYWINGLPPRAGVLCRALQWEFSQPESAPDFSLLRGTKNAG